MDVCSSGFAVRRILADHAGAESAVTGVPLHVDRLRSSAAPAVFTLVALGEVSVVAGNFGVPIHSRGEVDADTTLVGLQMAPLPGHWNGHAFSEHTAWIYGPGTEHDGVGLEPTYFAAIALPTALADALRGDATSAGLLQLSSGAHTASLRGVTTDLVDLATITSTQSGRLEPRIAGPALAALIDSLAAVLRRGQGTTRLDRGAAARVVDRCMEAAADLGPQPSPLDLGAAVGLSDRRIRAAFNERFGVPAATYFRQRALHAAHRDLVRAQPGQTTVAAVATRWGFWHLGRFAQRHRDQFGVSPSTTLSAMPRQETWTGTWPQDTTDTASVAAARKGQIRFPDQLAGDLSASTST